MKIGDIVYHKSFGEGKIIGLYSVDVLVEFKNFVHGHDGGGIGKPGHCYFLYYESLITQNSIKYYLEVKNARIYSL